MILRKINRKTFGNIRNICYICYQMEQMVPRGTNIINLKLEKMRNLTNEQVAKIIFWTETEGQKNWGLWDSHKYPINGCSYTSIEDCTIYIKFDVMQNYNGEKFKVLMNARKRTYMKEGRMTISNLEYYYKQSGDEYLNELRSNKS